MIRSAPARRIASRLSSTARGFSSQPRSIAACSMLYSPLTWYAKSGGWKRPGPAPAMATQGRAGVPPTGARPPRGAGGERGGGGGLGQRRARGRRVHLVAAPVAALRRRLGRLAEGAVERRRVLRRVGEDHGLLEPRCVERAPDRRDAAVHHVARRD